MKSLPEQIEFYLLRCEVEGKSPNTVRAYGHTLKRFARGVGDVDIAAISQEQLYGYLAQFSACTLETRHRYFREIRCFFNWLIACGRLEHNPFRGMRNVRLPSRIVQPFTPPQIGARSSTCSDHAAPSQKRQATGSATSSGRTRAATSSLSKPRFQVP